MPAKLQAAIDAVRQAAVVCRHVQADLVTAATLEKKDRSPVTVADFASQAIVCHTLEQALDDAPVVGEEAAAELRGDDAAQTRTRVVEQVREAIGINVTDDVVLDWIDLGGVDPATTDGNYWTLDPIDGTKGFLRGEQYAIALGYIQQGEVVLGVLGCPNLPMPGFPDQGTLLIAVKGKGASMLPLQGGDDPASGLSDSAAIKVSDMTDPADARLTESVESGHSDQDQSVIIAKSLGITNEPVRMDSQCKYAAIARGDASIYLRLPTRKDYREKIWDHAAGMLIVQEAGGKVTGVHGKPLDFSKGRKLEDNAGVIATNGHIHDAVVAAVGKVLG